MGSLSPSSSWTPQDDLLLINAVMTGASLELLLRRFNDQELQARWRTLLCSLDEKEIRMQNTLVPLVRDGADTLVPLVRDEADTFVSLIHDEANTLVPLVRDGADTLVPLVRDGADTLVPLVHDGADTFVSLVRDGADTFVPLVRDGADTLVPLVRDGADTLVPLIRDEADTLVPLVRDGADTLVPLVRDGADTFVPLVCDGADTLVPLVRNGADRMDTSGYDISTTIISSSSMRDQISRCIDDELSLPFMGLDENDETFDVSSFLLDTPYEESDMIDKNKDVSEIPKAPDQEVYIPDGACSRELSDKYVDPANPEMRDGVICCTLNTEVLEVPQNDNVFLLH
ncbi:hypothetical protein KY290_026861 [Solanum tuberosum]|uniref:Uncharacterized protein n=2 Tax=Solanum tuberosum TaxID=4113 RepID=A0ABQ7UZQ9_SOLTU|nr:hypothetical protein KY289_025322 [Solanum tuberosum]KAH0674017.1 hypothetical protein KY284_025104 [Solanum tuberosum]KAH0677925.1 hypothetical protein KY285_025726 [Solanum tuberosum]KAH0756591.1 hypothetical protein KY290_026861 [Solanum tuberosum]